MARKLRQFAIYWAAIICLQAVVFDVALHGWSNDTTRLACVLGVVGSAALFLRWRLQTPALLLVLPPAVFAVLIALVLYGADHAHRGPWFRLGLKGLLVVLLVAFISDLVITLRKMPNQLPDPTSKSVTPPAGAGGAPSDAADH